LQQGRIAHLRAEREQARSRLLMTAIFGLALALGVFGFFYGKVRRQRRRLARSAAELRRLNATKDELMSIIGHDLRGPVAAFQQVGGLVAHYAAHPDPAELRELAQELDAGARELGTLLDNLLHWARTQTGQVLNHPEDVSLDVALASAMALFRPAAAAKHVALQTNVVPGTPPAVRADPHLLATVLRNLVSNAVKFTPENGHVEVAAQIGTPGWVELTVSDTGVGLTPEQKELLFSLHPDRSTAGTAGEGGTGLGLLVVRHFVALLGSELRLTSEAGQGARFSFTLPVA
jgi:signal transduction histidine kinase